jgi:hypothetical protein
MIYLTKHQIERQDFVDNAIFEFIQTINQTGKETAWDIEIIGDVRDLLKEWFVNKLNITTEQEFYPYL